MLAQQVLDIIKKFDFWLVWTSFYNKFLITQVAECPTKGVINQHPFLNLLGYPVELILSQVFECVLKIICLELDALLSS